MRNLVALSAATLLLAACGSQPPAPEQDPSGVESRNPNALSSGVKPAGGFDPMSIAALKDPRSPLSKRAIYFDIDSFVVKSEYQQLLETHAKFLKANPSMKILVQGNGDERGSREYNLSLGQNRANAVKKTLALLGVSEAQIESVSLGEEKPVCNEQSDDCWAQNRRADILYSGEF